MKQTSSRAILSKKVAKKLRSIAGEDRRSWLNLGLCPGPDWIVLVLFTFLQNSRIAQIGLGSDAQPFFSKK
jgi:hypothetical protein